MSAELLIDPDELSRLIESQAPPAILDVRWELSTGANRDAYLEAHIPGAVFVDLDRQLADPPSEHGRHPLPRAERFTEAMQAAGVSAGRLVVVYDAATSMAAARAWWLLRYFGHRHVAVLDGGLRAWIDDGHPVTGAAPSAARGDFVSRAGGMPMIGPGQSLEVSAQGLLIDARAQERFLGLAEPIDPVAGHIPGARNRPASENVGPDGRFLKASDLRASFERIGVREGGPIAAYCGSGVAAAHEVLALELAGFIAALYPGSWSEWIADPERPIERSADALGE